MHDTRQKAFADPSLTLDQDWRHSARALMALQKRARLLPEGDDLRIFSDQLVEWVHPAVWYAATWSTGVQLTGQSTAIDAPAGRLSAESARF